MDWQLISMVFNFFDSQLAKTRPIRWAASADSLAMQRGFHGTESHPLVPGPAAVLLSSFQKVLAYPDVFKSTPCGFVQLISVFKVLKSLIHFEFVFVQR